MPTGSQKYSLYDLTYTGYKTRDRRAIKNGNYRLDDRGSISGSGADFVHHSELVQPPVQWPSEFLPQE
jgi:hypothetical protein